MLSSALPKALRRIWISSASVTRPMFRARRSSSHSAIRIRSNIALPDGIEAKAERVNTKTSINQYQLTSRAPGPDTVYADTTFDDDIESALAALPPEFRAAVVLCDVEGLSYDEIADILGAKLGTVRSRIHRGRAQLRAALAHRAPHEGRQRYAGPLPAPTPELRT